MCPLKLAQRVQRWTGGLFLGLRVFLDRHAHIIQRVSDLQQETRLDTGLGVGHRSLLLDCVERHNDIAEPV